MRTTGAESDGHSERPHLSPEGRFVAFESDAIALLIFGASSGNWSSTISTPLGPTETAMFPPIRKNDPAALLDLDRELGSRSTSK